MALRARSSRSRITASRRRPSEAGTCLTTPPPAQLASTRAPRMPLAWRRRGWDGRSRLGWDGTPAWPPVRRSVPSGSSRGGAGGSPRQSGDRSPRARRSASALRSAAESTSRRLQAPRPCSSNRRRCHGSRPRAQPRSPPSSPVRRWRGHAGPRARGLHPGSHGERGMTKPRSPRCAPAPFREPLWHRAHGDRRVREASWLGFEPRLSRCARSPTWLRSGTSSRPGKRVTRMRRRLAPSSRGRRGRRCPRWRDGLQGAPTLRQATRASGARALQQEVALSRVEAPRRAGTLARVGSAHPRRAGTLALAIRRAATSTAVARMPGLVLDPKRGPASRRAAPAPSWRQDPPAR